MYEVYDDSTLGWASEWEWEWAMGKQDMVLSIAYGKMGRIYIMCFPVLVAGVSSLLYSN